MAIRYSGDAEVRLGWDERAKVYRGSVRAVTTSGTVFRWRGTWRPSSWFFLANRTSSSSYDAAAKGLLAQAKQSAGRMGKSLSLEGKRERVTLRRVFQAPCPTGDDQRTQRRARSKTAHSSFAPPRRRRGLR